jgi:hypothetical protein
MIAKTIYCKKIKGILLYALFVFMANTCIAQLALPDCFTDNMVLQQRAKVNFWGTETPGTNFVIVTSWNNKTYHVKTDHHGDWKIKVSPRYSVAPIPSHLTTVK